MKKYLVELIGTFFLVLVIGSQETPWLRQRADGNGLHGRHVSGAHYNPAVTLAVLLQKKIDTKDAGMYMVFQILGSIGAALIAYIITGNTFAPSPSASFTTIAALLSKSFSRLRWFL